MSSLCLSLGLGQAVAPVGQTAAPPVLPPAPLLRLLDLPDGTVEVEAGTGIIDVTVSGGTPHDGTYALDTALLATGPVNLSRPRTSGAAAPGGRLDAIPGLWVYDSALGTPAVSLQWQRDGAAIPGATGPSHVLGTADAGTSIVLAETATQAAGARTALSDATAIAAAVALVREAEGTISIEATAGVLTVTVSGGTSHDGTYVLDTALLAAGPVNLVAPEVTGTAATGAELTATTGLWVYDTALGAPVFEHQWLADGTALAGAVAPVLAVPAAAAGKTVTLSLTARQAAGARSARSNGIAIPVASFANPTSLGAKLIFWGDLTDTATLWQNADGTGAATAAGNPVRRIRDKSGRANHFAVGGATPGNATVIAGGVDWNDAGFLPAAAMTGLTSGMEAFALIDPAGDTAWTLLGRNLQSGFAAGTAANGDTAAPAAGFTGTLTHSVDGTDLTSPTRDTIHDAVIAAGGFTVQALRGIDLTGYGADLMLLAFTTGAIRFAGNARHVILTTSLTAAERSDLTNWLISEAA